MLPPFKGSKDGLSPERYFWSYIQSSSRMPVERTFGMLKARWRILLKRCDMQLQNVPKMVRTCLVLHNMCIIHADAFDDRWVREGQGELERAQAEVQVTAMDVFMQRGLNDALAEVSCLLETEPFQAAERAQNVESAPPDTTIRSGTRRRDNLAKVMFNEWQRKNARVVFGDEDTADESFDSD
ncbi:hypothetical protein L7F22_004795 [Adiantum nelumboides]|nr:hypothetical protein [Adiantum nelumboides]